MKRTIASAVDEPKQSRAAVFAALGFLCGCILASRLDTGAWLLAPAALCAPLFMLLRKRGKRGYAALFLCLTALGALMAGNALHPAAPASGIYRVEGSVYGGCKLRAGERLVFTLCDITLDGKPVSGRAYCSYYFDDTPPELFDGAKIALNGRVYTPDGKSGEPRFNFRLWMYQNGMSFGIAASRDMTVLNSPDTAPTKDVAYRVRDALSRSLERVMGDGSRLAVAMLLSEREGMTEDESEAFRTLGIAHVLSVSGLHVGLLCALLSAIMKAMHLRSSLQLAITAAFLAFYCMLTGFSAASARAAVTLLLLLTARAVGRNPDPLVSISAAMLAVLAINPLQAYSAGFALSFSAVAAITLIYPAVMGWLNRAFPSRWLYGWRVRITRSPQIRALGRLVGTPRSLIAVSVSAQLGVLAPTAIFFGRLPLYGILINIALIPFAALLVPIYALTLIMSPIPALGTVVGFCAARLGDVFLWLVGLLSRLPYASVRVPAPSAAIVCLIAAAIAILSRRLCATAPKRALALALCVAVGLVGARLARPPEVRYVQLAVGQADAALLFDGDKTVAIDVCEDGGATLDYLTYYGRDLDALVITHLHYDHAGGVSALIESGIRIGCAYLPVNAGKQRLDAKCLELITLLKRQGVPIYELASGDELRYNSTVLRVKWPMRGMVRAGQDANDLPLVLAIDIGGQTLLSMSDLTGDYEAYAAEPCAVLKAAHHGSADSTSAAMLDYCAPKAALISCSSGSRSLPGAALIGRLSERGIPYARTDACGDVTIVPADGGLMVIPYKARLCE